jgi:hypothetical protein
VCGVDVRVHLVTAVLADKVVPLADSQQTAPGAGPACVSRINLSHKQAADLRFILDSSADFPPMPKREATAQGFTVNPALFGLWHVPQVLKDENRVGWSPLYQGSGCLSSEGAGAVALLAAKPFEHTTDASCIPVLCLSGRKFILESCTCLLGAAVLDLDCLAGDKERVTVWVYRDEGIGFVQVNANRQRSNWFGYFKRNGYTTKQLPIPFNNGQTINLLGLLQSCLEHFRHGVRQAFASADGPDGQGAINTEVGITSTFADEKDRPWSTKVEWTGDTVPITFCALISGGDGSDCRDGHLAVETTLHFMVCNPMQRDWAERLTVVEGNWRKIGLYLTEDLQGLPQVWVRLDDDSHSSLNAHHALSIAGSTGNVNPEESARRCLLPTPKGGGTRHRAMFAVGQPVGNRLRMLGACGQSSRPWSFSWSQPS